MIQLPIVLLPNILHQMFLTIYKDLNKHYYDLYQFNMYPFSCRNFITDKEKYQSLSSSLQVHIVVSGTIKSDTSPIFHVKLTTSMNNYYVFNLTVYVVFAMSPRLGIFVPLPSDLIVSLSLKIGLNILGLIFSSFRPTVKYFL